MKFLIVAMAMLAVTGCNRSYDVRSIERIHATETHVDVYSRADSCICAVETNYIASMIVIGPVSINCTNGAITIDKGITMDEASRKFWEGLTNAFPQNFSHFDFTNVFRSTANIVNDLAASGDICRVFGHRWGEINKYGDWFCGRVETKEEKWK